MLNDIVAIVIMATVNVELKGRARNTSVVMRCVTRYGKGRAEECGRLVKEVHVKVE